MTTYGAGDFRWPYAYYQCVRATDGTTGAQPRQYGISPYTNTQGTGPATATYGTANATYWGTEELQSSQQEVEFGAVRTRWYGQIRLRNVLTISSEDRLIGGVTGNTLYIIDGVRIDWPNNVTILDVHSMS